MTAKTHRPSFWALQIPGWLLLVYLVFAQGIAAFDYELGVSMQTQEPAEMITEVGTAFWYGFALGDVLVYIPILLVGLIGHLRGALWGRTAIAAALGITVYWPIVCLAAMVKARDATGWHFSNETPYWVVLTLISIWGAWGLVTVLKESQPGGAHKAGWTPSSHTC